MSSNRIPIGFLLALTMVTAGVAPAQSQGAERPGDDSSPARDGALPKGEFAFRNRKDSLDWVKNKALADKARGFRIVVSLQQHRLWAIIDDDTLLTAPAAVAKGNTLSYQGLEKTFTTPRGKREVLSKDADPVWNPPDWMYYETAKEYGLKVKHIPAKDGLTMPDGRKLIVQDNEIKVVLQDGEVTSFATDLHIIFDDVLYIPPIGTENRRVNGTLGKYKLSLGEGYMLHGTNNPKSVGLAVTHGCIRLDDDDIQWMYENVPVGTRVYIY